MFLYLHMCLLNKNSILWQNIFTRNYACWLALHSLGNFFMFFMQCDLSDLPMTSGCNFALPSKL